MPQLAIAWLLRRDAVSSVIIGASSVEQVEKNVAAIDVELTADDVTEIEGVFSPAAQGAEDQAPIHATAS